MNPPLMNPPVLTEDTENKNHTWDHHAVPKSSEHLTGHSEHLYAPFTREMKNKVSKLDEAARSQCCCNALLLAIVATKGVAPETTGLYPHIVVTRLETKDA